MNTISGLIKPKVGTIEFMGDRIEGLSPHQIVPLGLSHVLERRRVFPYMSVWENLVLGAYLEPDEKIINERLEWVFSLFPILEDRRNQEGRKLSGGEQQMLSVSRGLMAGPKMIMLDEPFLGLAPLMEIEIIKAIKKINRDGITVLFIEQNVQQALDISQRGYIIESGLIALEGHADILLKNPRVRQIYLT
jgi:branched-chain amino acid transport system ATP-binding protein